MDNEPLTTMEQQVLDNDAATALLLEGHGYYDFTVAQLPGRREFVASAVKTVGVATFPAQAMGETKAVAARNLVRLVER